MLMCAQVTYLSLYSCAHTYHGNGPPWGLSRQRICLPAVWETQVQSLGWEDPLEKEMANCSTIPAWKSPWTEEPGGLQSMGSQELDTTHQNRNNNGVKLGYMKQLISFVIFRKLSAGPVIVLSSSEISQLPIYVRTVCDLFGQIKEINLRCNVMIS